MSVELEALVGHLFVVDGRPVSTASPGAMASPPPRRAARGRDLDTFFGLITMGEGQRAPAALYEQLAGLVSSKYFATSGSATSALREAIGAINAAVRSENAGRTDPFDIGFVCAVLRENELIIAVSGPARGFLAKGSERVERLPDAYDLAEPMTPLGRESEPDIRFYRRLVQAEDFLILSDSGLAPLGEVTLREALGGGRVETAITSLRASAASFTTAVVIQFVAPLIAPSSPEEGAFQAAELPEPTPASHAVPAGGLSQTTRRMGRDAAMGAARFLEGTSALLGGTPEEESAPSEGLRRPTATQIAIIIAIAALVAGLTTVVYRLRGVASQFAQIIAAAETEIETARTTGLDQATARPHWERALFLLDQAEALQSDAATVSSYRTEALDALDAYDQVTRVDPVLLREYPPGAYLRGPVLHGLNLYVIDTASDTLYREDISEADGALTNRESQIIARQGELVGSQLVSGLIDLTWVEEGASPQRNVLAALSRNGLLITYSPSFAASAAALPDSQMWQDPRAIAFFDGDLYILDAGANQIWRYVSNGEGYPRAPEGYFTDIDPGLTDAVDMDIDANGRIYVIHADGRVTKYFLGNQEYFAFQGLPQPIMQPTALYLNASIYDPAFYIADAGGGRLYTTTTTTGAFLRSYKDRDNALFMGLSGVCSAEGTNYVYITAGSALYRFERP